MTLILDNIIGTLETDYIPFPYKKDRPKDRALIISNGNITRVLEHIGPGIDYEVDGCGVDHVFELSQGIWLWEGKVIYTRDYWGEYDCDITGEPRPLTDEELETYADGKPLWNEDDWIEKDD